MGDLLEFLGREVHSEAVIESEEIRLEERKMHIIRTALGELLSHMRTLMINRTPLGGTKDTAIRIINAVISTISNKQKKDFLTLRGRQTVVRETALKVHDLAHEAEIAGKAAQELSMLVGVLEDQAAVLSGLKDAISRQDIESMPQLWTKLLDITSREAGLLNQFRIDEEMIRRHVEALARSVNRHVIEPKARAEIISIAELRKKKEADELEGRARMAA